MEIRYYKKALYKPGDMVHQGDFGGNLAHPIQATRWATSRRLFRLRPRPSWCQRAGAADRRATEFSGSPRAIPTAAGAGPCLRPVAVARGSQDGDQERSEVVRELNSRLCLPSCCLLATRFWIFSVLVSSSSVGSFAQLNLFLHGSWANGIWLLNFPCFCY